MTAMKKGFLLLFMLFAGFLLTGRAGGAMREDDFVNLCRYGTLDAIKDAIKDGANVNASGGDGYTALMSAARRRQDPRADAPEVMKLLIDAGAELSAKYHTGNIGWSVLMEALFTENPEVIRFLINAGVDINAEYDDDYTEVSWMIRYAPAGYPTPEVIGLLLEAGLVVNEKVLNGLHSADYLKGTGLIEEMERRFKTAAFGSAAFGSAKVSAKGATVLLATEAELRDAPDVIVEGNPPNLGGWKAGNTVIFLLNVEKAGKYKVALTYSKHRGAGDPADLKIAAGEFSIAGPLPVTGDNWSNYVEYDFGRLSLPKGQTSLEIASTKSGGGYVMNLRSMRLVPAE
jgi:hypothetical protein